MSWICKCGWWSSDYNKCEAVKLTTIIIDHWNMCKFNAIFWLFWFTHTQKQNEREKTETKNPTINCIVRDKFQYVQIHLMRVPHRVKLSQIFPLIFLSFFEYNLVKMQNFSFFSILGTPIKMSIEKWMQMMTIKTA